MSKFKVGDRVKVNDLDPLSTLPQPGDTVRVSYEAKWHAEAFSDRFLGYVKVEKSNVRPLVPLGAKVEVIKRAEPDWYTRDKAAVVDAYGVVWQRRSGHWLSTVGAPGNIANLVAGGAKLIYDPANDDK